VSESRGNILYYTINSLLKLFRSIRIRLPRLVLSAQQFFDVSIVLAGKPSFYTEKFRPFREVDSESGKTLFRKITTIEKNKVYTAGCLRELIRLLPDVLQGLPTADGDFCELGSMPENDGDGEDNAACTYAPNVLYIGDSIFADLVDAKREFGWTTAGVIAELQEEVTINSNDDAICVKESIEILLHALRKIQSSAGLGTKVYTAEDKDILDKLELMVSEARTAAADLRGTNFGSIFRARHELSLFASSMRKYCDIYMSSTESLINYSMSHRFYPKDVRAAPHEIM